MEGLKWIKLGTEMFNDDKIKVIQSMPEGDAMLVIWIRLLTLAGASNADGYLMIAENVPYTESMLSTVFGKPLTVIRLALRTFEAFGMLENNPEGIFLPDFVLEQGDKVQDIREYNRIKKAESRERARQARMKMLGTAVEEVRETDDTMQGSCREVCQETAGGMSVPFQDACQETPADMSQERQETSGDMIPACQETVPDMSMTCQGKCQTIDIDKELEKEIKDTISPDQSDPGDAHAQVRLDYDRITGLYNSVCRDLPRVRGMTDERRRKVRTLLKSLDKARVLAGMDPYGRLEYIFRLADESDFLSGREKANNWCGFDWLVNSKNALKVIEGNYRNKGGVNSGSYRGRLQQEDAGHSRESEDEALAAFRAGRDRHGTQVQVPGMP